MGTQRTSQKDVLNAINDLTSVITQLVSNVAQAPVTPPVMAAPVEAAPVSTGESTVQIAPGYLQRMTAKVEGLTKVDGETRVLYTRRNLAGETKLAYCLGSRWSTLKDKGLIGAIKIIK
jgi:hypothetical protein